MITGIGIHIKVFDFSRSKAFYEALGFRKVFEYGSDKAFRKDRNGNLVSAPEEYQGIVFQQAGCKVEIADGHRAVNASVFRKRVSSSKISLKVNVDRLDKIINRCNNARIPLAVLPRHFYWGTLEVVVKDPDGVVLVFIAPYSEADARSVHADESWARQPGQPTHVTQE